VRINATHSLPRKPRSITHTHLFFLLVWIK
jgi:hypothetical protein